MAVLALAEIDLGGFGKFLTDLANALHGITVGLLAVVVGAAAAGVGVGTGAVLSGIVSALTAAGIGVAAGVVAVSVLAAAALIVGTISAIVFGLLKKWWGDEIFVPHQTIPVTLDSRRDRFPGNSPLSPVETAVYLDFGGHYEADYRWRPA
jgi:hypothetical protein